MLSSSDAQSNSLSFTTTVVSSNEKCPVERYELVEGAEYFDLVNVFIKHTF